MLEIGSYVDGKYKVLNKVGQGGMSVVYLAMNEKANKQWAIKEVRKDGMKNFEVVKQGLVVETELLKKLNHPNLPSIIDVIDDEDTFLIVMDYIQGNPLDKTLEEYGAQPQEYVIEWAKQLCDVLGYLHTRKPPIVYRDMKPSNVMLKPDGNLTLIDFGTAREFKEQNLADTTCLGTQGYAAPEQFGGQGQTDARTDIYCLGGTLYHLVTGWNPCFPPYEIKPIREINPALSGGLEQIILKCTQRNPDDRYQSTAELLYDLEHYDEIDIAYKKKQTGRLTRFILSAALALIFVVVGIAGKAMSVKTANDTYAVKVADAKKITDMQRKIATYEDAIEIIPGDIEAYVGLISAFKEDDRFIPDEKDVLESKILQHKSELLKNQKKYAELCFEVGKLYWYYYSYGGSDDNKITRMTSSVTWFDDALSYGGDAFLNKNMSQVYRDIGGFYENVKQSVVEGKDKGIYKPFWDNLKQLIGTVESDNEEIVKLELYELTRNAIQQYTTKLKSDGVTKDDMLSVYSRLETDVKAVSTTTDTTADKKNHTVSLLGDTKRAIETAFGVE